MSEIQMFNGPLQNNQDFPFDKDYLFYTTGGINDSENFDHLNTCPLEKISTELI